jgi:gamma-glutamylcyclotransferase (GGCT)/AIG2-like uncharacterized protein YtfP
MPDRHAEDPSDLVVVYGTLRSGTGWRERLGVSHLVESVAGCRVAGSLYELGWYPGLVLDGAGEVVAEVLRLLDQTALDALDRFEGYDAARPDAGEYRRQLIVVEVGGDDLAAWVYVLPDRPAGRPRVDGGDWLAHVGLRGQLAGREPGPPRVHG